MCLSSLMDERAHGEQKGTSWESGRESLGERARDGWMNAEGNAWETYRTTQPENRRENLERTHGTRHEKMCEGWHSRRNVSEGENHNPSGNPH